MIIVNHLGTHRQLARSLKWEVGQSLLLLLLEKNSLFTDLTVKGFLRSVIDVGTELTVHHVGKRVPLKLQKVVAWCSRSLND